MKIRYTKTGGIAGLHIHYELDTARMNDGANLEELVAHAKFFQLKDRANEHIRDGFHYTITVNDGEKQKTISFDDGTYLADDEAVKDLVDAVEAAGNQNVPDLLEELASGNGGPSLLPTGKLKDLLNAPVAGLIYIPHKKP